MSFARLALVELQLVLKCLDTPSILAAARCYRFTLAAASHPFAWIHAPPPRVCSLTPNLPVLLSRSLLRFVRGVDMRWIIVSLADDRFVHYQQELKTICSLPSILQFDTLSRGGLPLAPVLGLPCFQNLQSLAHDSCDDPELGAALPRLLRLHTLRIQEPIREALLESFQNIPSLTDLHVDLSRTNISRQPTSLPLATAGNSNS